MERRNFLSWMGVGLLASSLPVAIAACTSQNSDSGTSAADSPQTETPPRDDGFAAVGTLANLDAAGFLADPKFTGGPVAIVRDPQQKDTLVAINSTCPHKDCLVDWKVDQQAFVCPCHASAFAVDGTVKKGPAKASLKSLTVKVEGDLVLVKV